MVLDNFFKTSNSVLFALESFLSSAITLSLEVEYAFIVQKTFRINFFMGEVQKIFEKVGAGGKKDVEIF